MNVKKLIIATVAGFVVMFAMSGLWYQVIMKDYYALNFGDIMKTDINMLYIGIGYLAAALLLAYIYPIGYKGGSPAKEGMRFGIVMGLLLAIPWTGVQLGAYKVILSASLVNAVYLIVEKTIGGIVIGFVYGKGGQ